MPWMSCSRAAATQFVFLAVDSPVPQFHSSEEVTAPGTRGTLGASVTAASGKGRDSDRGPRCLGGKHGSGFGWRCGAGDPVLRPRRHTGHTARGGRGGDRADRRTHVGWTGHFKHHLSRRGRCNRDSRRPNGPVDHTGDGLHALPLGAEHGWHVGPGLLHHCRRDAGGRLRCAGAAGRHRHADRTFSRRLGNDHELRPGDRPGLRTAGATLRASP